MTANEKFKNIYENAYLQQKNDRINYTQFKNMIETAYLQHIQAIELNYTQFKNMIETAYHQQYKLSKRMLL